MHYNIFQVMEEQGMRKHKGGCQCGKVRYEIIAPSQVSAIECSCKPCQKRAARYFSVPADHFRLMEGHGALTTFGGAQARHSFCSSCGVQSFCIPSFGENSHVVGIMPHCLDPGTMKKVKTEKRDIKKCPTPHEECDVQTPEGAAAK